MNTETHCQMCKKIIRWDEDGQEWLDESGSGLCSFFDLEDQEPHVEEFC